MKATGVTRPVDELGRVVLPKELRKSLGIVENEDRLEIFVDGHDIILRKYNPGCDIAGCKEADNLHEFGGMKFCNHHWEALKEIARKEMR
jgi:transcriptional pleiotropic regulator of transition state genes